MMPIEDIENVGFCMSREDVLLPELQYRMAGSLLVQGLGLGPDIRDLATLSW